MDPGWSGRGIAVVVLGVQCAVGKAAIGLVLLPLLLQQICDGVQQVVQELVGILLHVVVKQLCGLKSGETLGNNLAFTHVKWVLQGLLHHLTILFAKPCDELLGWDDAHFPLLVGDAVEQVGQACEQVLFTSRLTAVR